MLQSQHPVQPGKQPPGLLVSSSLQLLTYALSQPTSTGCQERLESRPREQMIDNVQEAAEPGALAWALPAKG